MKLFLKNDDIYLLVQFDDQKIYDSEDVVKMHPTSRINAHDDVTIFVVDGMVSPFSTNV